jgi:hypothetical protein
MDERNVVLMVLVPVLKITAGATFAFGKPQTNMYQPSILY